MKTAAECLPTEFFDNVPINSIKHVILRAWRERYGPRCLFCGHMMDFNNKFHVSKHRATIDHIVARSLGGKDALDNYQVICAQCNTTKSQAEKEAASILYHDEEAQQFCDMVNAELFAELDETEEPTNEDDFRSL